MAIERNLSANIETRVELEPGHLYVSAHEDFKVSGDDIAALDRAIAEAKAYIAQVRRIKRHVVKHGVGVAPPRSGVKISAQDVADAWAKAISAHPQKNIFESDSVLFGSLMK
jgi:hypothetical protein